VTKFELGGERRGPEGSRHWIRPSLPFPRQRRLKAEVHCNIGPAESGLVRS
jgi:hypothetical protein